jgi:hypothetical protein
LLNVLLMTQGLIGASGAIQGGRDVDQERNSAVEQKDLMAGAPVKKEWTEPEITWHKELQAVTLAVQCANSFPPCTSSVFA